MDHVPMEALMKRRTKKRQEPKPPAPFQLPSRRNTAVSSDIPSPSPTAPRLIDIQDGKDDGPDVSTISTRATTSSESTTSGSSSIPQEPDDVDVFSELGLDPTILGDSGKQWNVATSVFLPHSPLPWQSILDNIQNTILERDTYYLNGPISAKDWGKVLEATGQVKSLSIQGSTLQDGTRHISRSSALQLFSTHPRNPIFSWLSSLTIKAPTDLHAYPFLLSPALQSLVLSDIPENLYPEALAFLKSLNTTCSQLGSLAVHGLPLATLIPLIPSFRSLTQLTISASTTTPSPTPFNLRDMFAALGCIPTLRSLALALGTLPYTKANPPSKPERPLQLDTFCFVGVATCLDDIFSHHLIQGVRRLAFHSIEPNHKAPGLPPQLIFLRDLSVSKLDLRGSLLAEAFELWCRQAHQAGESYPNITNISLIDTKGSGLSFNLLPIVAEVYPNLIYLSAPIAPEPLASKTNGAPLSLTPQHPLKTLVTPHHTGEQLSVQVVIGLARALATTFPLLGRLEIRAGPGESVLPGTWEAIRDIFMFK